jgi:hypothetical protein
VGHGAWVRSSVWSLLCFRLLFACHCIPRGRLYEPAFATLALSSPPRYRLPPRSQVETCTAYFSISKQMLWSEVDADVLEETAKHLLKEANSKLNSSLRSSDAFQGLIRTIKNFLNTCPLILQLRQPSMRPRHWKLLQVCAGGRCGGPAGTRERFPSQAQPLHPVSVGDVDLMCECLCVCVCMRMREAGGHQARVRVTAGGPHPAAGGTAGS